MAKIKQVGMFYQSHCDVCNVQIRFKETPVSSVFACPKCNSVLISLEDKSSSKSTYWVLIEVGYLVLDSWKPNEKGKCKYAKHIDGDKQNNSLDNLKWSNKPDLW